MDDTVANTAEGRVGDTVSYTAVDAEDTLDDALVTVRSVEG